VSVAGRWSRRRRSLLALGPGYYHNMCSTLLQISTASEGRQWFMALFTFNFFYKIEISSIFVYI